MSDKKHAPRPYLFEVGKEVQFKPRCVPNATAGKIVAQTIIYDDSDAILAYDIVIVEGRQIKVREYDIIGAPERVED